MSEFNQHLIMTLLASITVTAAVFIAYPEIRPALRRMRIARSAPKLAKKMASSKACLSEKCMEISQGRLMEK